jgi:hypothetical protein
MRSLRDLEAALEGQHQRRAELEAYMGRLHEHTGEDGAKLVELPRSYAVMVEEMIRQQRGEHQSLQGWLGPRRCAPTLLHLYKLQLVAVVCVIGRAGQDQGVFVALPFMQSSLPTPPSVSGITSSL